MKIGLALGSGGSRGWSHIGIIKALAKHGVEPEIICGTSIGALVGAAYVSNNLNQLENWVCSLTKFETARFFEINASLNGFVNTEKLNTFLSQYVAGHSLQIHELDKKFASVATDLDSGREIWLTQDSLLNAVWSSISIPGLFPAIKHDNNWLVDGGLVNPVPISLCRALGADIVIAVNLNGDLVTQNNFKPNTPSNSNKAKSSDSSMVGRISNFVTEYTNSLFPASNTEDKPPSLFEAIANSVNITQDRITRSRMAGDPPDILLTPKLAHMGMLEFYKADEAIAEGRGCVERLLPEIKHVLNMK